MNIEKKEIMDEILKRVAKKLDELGATDNNKHNCSCCSTTDASTIPSSKPAACNTTSSGEEIYNKRLLSEKDMIEYNKAEKKRIVYSKRTIVTDVAKEYAKKFNIELIEECFVK